MNILDKLLKTKGWSSKKFTGLFLIINATIMGYLALTIESINTVESMVVIGPFLISGLTALGIDAYNKTQHLINKK